MTIRHQLGGTYPAIANGQILQPSRTHLRINRKRAIVRIRLPLSFYEGITSLTEGMSLGVVTLDKKCNTTDTTVELPNNANRPISQSTPSGARPPSPSSVRRLASEMPTKIESYGEVGTYNCCRRADFPHYFRSSLSLSFNFHTNSLFPYLLLLRKKVLPSRSLLTGLRLTGLRLQQSHH